MTEKPKAGKDSTPITLISDPFGIKTLEISEAQDSHDEVDENFIAEEGELGEADLNDPNLDNKLDSLSRAMEEEGRRQEKEARESVQKGVSGGESEQELAERLAREIAEDQALAAQLAKEADEMDAADPELQAALPKNLDLEEMQSCIESLLFLSDKPMSVNRLRELLGPDFPLSIFQEAVTALKDAYQATKHGIELVDIAGGLQFRTKPGRAALARKLAKVQTQRLSSGAMESLAIVAYRQPVMKEDIDKIRGVDSSYFIRGLLDRKLIRIAGRSELPGRPMVYGTTDEFLEVFGLKDLSAMPSLREVEQMIPTSQTGNEKDEDPRVRELRKLVGQMNSDTSTSLIYDHNEDEQILQDIRERVSSIPSSTPYLEEQKALEKQAKDAAKARVEDILKTPEGAEGNETRIQAVLAPEAAQNADSGPAEQA